MLIAPHVYAPSKEEEKCIKQAFVDQKTLEEAYNDCGAGDIMPRWPGGLEMIRSAFMTAMAKNLAFPALYEVTKRSYQIYGLQPSISPPSTSPSISPSISPPAEEKKKKTPTLLYIVIAAVVFFLFSE